MLENHLLVGDILEKTVTKELPLYVARETNYSQKNIYIFTDRNSFHYFYRA